MDSGDESDDTQTGEPAPAATGQSSADRLDTVEPVPVPKPDEGTMPPKGSKPEQLHADPAGDAYPAVANIEGLLDKSDDAT